MNNRLSKRILEEAKLFKARWSKSKLLDSIKDPFVRQTVAVLLENQKLMSESSRLMNERDEMIDVKTEFTPGQIVKVDTDDWRSDGLWKVIKYQTQSSNKPGIHIWRCESLLRPGVESSFFNCNMKVIEEKVSVVANTCTCSIVDLMTRGCKCGQMDRDRVVS